MGSKLFKDYPEVEELWNAGVSGRKESILNNFKVSGYEKVMIDEIESSLLYMFLSGYRYGIVNTFNLLKKRDANLTEGENED